MDSRWPGRNFVWDHNAIRLTTSLHQTNIDNIVSLTSIIHIETCVHIIRWQIRRQVEMREIGRYRPHLSRRGRPTQRLRVRCINIWQTSIPDQYTSDGSLVILYSTVSKGTRSGQMARSTWQPSDLQLSPSGGWWQVYCIEHQKPKDRSAWSRK